ncbi:MAG: flavin reductase family protein [Spirochaetaceae bacterium]|jgi:flavin reductase (DIM6/NTAB) family NADH-FMN oxidoreductase RutF|nr:flavin reductase family protein [Spirochaetaceae bacterium]
MRIKVDLEMILPEVLKKLDKPGLILGSGEECNPMTIGWASYGIMWNKPVFTIMVRPVRHSFTLLEQIKEFTINVPSDNMNKEIGICGSKSGRDFDKLELCDFTAENSYAISVPYIKECPIHLECRTVFTNDVIAGSLNKEMIDLYYPHADLHRFYYGEIMGAWREEE